MARMWVSVLALAALLWSSGCTVGPSPWSTKVNDWQNRNYEESPFITGTLSSVIPFYPFVGFLASIPDVALFNPIQFWGYDFWESEGAPRVHHNPKGTHTPFYSWQEPHAEPGT